jgi:hypothetical protein
MAKSQVSLRDDQHQVGRRALMKWTIAAGAALGVSRTKVFEIIEKTGGRDLAFAASNLTATFSFHIESGNGGLAHYTQLWPFPGVAKANNPAFAYTFPGQANLLAGTDKPFYVGPATPGASFAPARQMTCFVNGTNETHSKGPGSSTETLAGNSIFAIATVLQANNPNIIPVLAVGTGNSIGTAAGAATPAGVANSAAMVGLFNSAASRMGGLLSDPGNAALYKAHYDAFTQLNRASSTSTQKLSYQTALGAAKFLGTNLASQLQVTNDDLTRYNITGSTRANYAELGRTMITAAKAYALGLTNCVYARGPDEDPHDMFDSMDNVSPTRGCAQLKQIFDGFFNDLTRLTDATTMGPIIDNFVLTIHGDTHKDPFSRPGWGDGTPNNMNVTYVLGSGNLRTGWFGDVTSGGGAQGFDETGNNVAYNGTATAKLATASIAYAIAKRDSRAISQFANGINLEKLTIPLDVA